MEFDKYKSARTKIELFFCVPITPDKCKEDGERKLNGVHESGLDNALLFLFSKFKRENDTLLPKLLLKFIYSERATKFCKCPPYF